MGVGRVQGLVSAEVLSGDEEREAERAAAPGISMCHDCARFDLRPRTYRTVHVHVRVCKQAQRSTGGPLLTLVCCTVPPSDASQLSVHSTQYVRRRSSDLPTPPTVGSDKFLPSTVKAGRAEASHTAVWSISVRLRLYCSFACSHPTWLAPVIPAASHKRGRDTE